MNKHQDWYRKWFDERDTKSAFNLLEQIYHNRGNGELTKQKIIFACFNAAHYKEENDEGFLYRKKMRTEKSKIKLLNKAARILSRSSMNNDTGLSWANYIAEGDSGVRISRMNYDENKAQHLVMYDYFSSLERALEKKLPEINIGPFHYKFTIGNLIFDEEISTGRPLTAETMLGFEIAFYLRMYTANREDDCIQNGQKMPEDGEPNLPIVASFCNSVFGNGFDPKPIGDKVRALKHAGLSLKWQGVN
jgi:hypothetical protein